MSEVKKLRRVRPEAARLEKLEADRRADVAKLKAKRGEPPFTPTGSAYKLMKGHHRRTWGRKGIQNKRWAH